MVFVFVFSVGLDVLLTIFQKVSKHVDVIEYDSISDGILVERVTSSVDDD
jgi:hypothetical protein